MAQRHVVVTGAGTGIGRAVARRVARDGAAVTLLGLEKAPLEGVAAEVDEPTHVGVCDIRDRKAVAEAVERAAAALGRRVDGLTASMVVSPSVSGLPA